MHANATLAQETNSGSSQDTTVLDFMRTFEVSEDLRGIELNGSEFEELTAEAQTQVLYHQLFSRILALSEHAPNLVLEGEYVYNLDDTEPFVQLVNLAAGLSEDLSLGGPFIGAVNQQLGTLEDLRRRIGNSALTEAEKQERLERIQTLEDRLEVQRDVLTDMRNYFNEFVTRDAPALVERAEIDASITNVRQFTDEIENFTSDLEELQRVFESDEVASDAVSD